MRQHVYARARAYWSAHQTTDRLQLTNAELDAQFAFIDADGVPRLHADGMDEPTTPLDGLIGLLDTDLTDLSTTGSESLHQHFKDRHDRLD